MQPSQPRVVVLLALTCFACAATRVPEPDAAPVAEPDAAPVAEPDAAPVAEPDAAPVAEPDAAPVAEPDAAWVAEADAGPQLELTLPLKPRRFSISLSAGPCYGDCPTYSVSIDQAGEVEFVGAQCVARPGVFTKQVAPAAARALYDAILASPYPRLGDRYVGQSDGCKVTSDAATSSWRVRGDDQEKTLTRYHGCEGIDGLKEVDALSRLVHEQSAVLSWLSPSPFNCQYQVAKMPTQTFYRLQRLGAPVGIVKIESSNGRMGSFTLADCDGTETARGTVGSEHDRLVLLGQARSAIALPAELGSVGSVVLEGKNAGLNELFVATRARGLLAESETELSLVESSTCQP